MRLHEPDAVATVKTDAHSLGSSSIDWLDVVGPIASLDSLPPPDTKRWVIRRKAEVVAAVRAGVISLEEACRRYELSGEEFLAWERGIENYGVPGLRATRLQIYYNAPPTQAKPRY